ncbi:MAG: hypothetical protein EB015_13895, partial [Methylocystaceae bacterium]|nr:hypothetical protein [Methylocystaceae bacterium]
SFFVIFFDFVCSYSSVKADVLGQKPNYVSEITGSIPNAQAITRMIWAPGLDDGYVPQGMTFAGGAIYMSAYLSTNTKSGKGACRIFKVDPKSGNQLGHFDLNDDCGHAGGLAVSGTGHLILADTHRLYKIELASAFSQTRSKNAMIATLDLRGKLKGSFVDFYAGSIFIGTYEKSASKSNGYYLPYALFDTHNGKTINETAASRSIALPLQSQGAAFDRAGHLWITSSNGQFGLLSRLDSKTGSILSTYEMVNGIEDIGFDETGRLWSVSESGSIRWRNRSVTFPVLFQIDMSKLK